jgi:hypothetical protein
MLFFYEVDAGTGTQLTGILEEDTLEKAEEVARMYAIENAESYGYEQNLEAFGCLDTVGKPNEYYDPESDDEDDHEEYSETVDVTWVVEPYDPLEHDDRIA